MNRRVAVRGVIVRDGKMLGLRLKQYAGKDVRDANDYLHVDLSGTTHGAIEIEDVAFIDPARENVRPEFLRTQSLPMDDSPVHVQFFNYL